LGFSNITGVTIGNDAPDGGNGKDVLNGGAGANTVADGSGNGTYFVDNVGDKVIEAAGGGTDTVRNSVSYTLGNNSKNLALTGAGAIDGSGNNLNNSSSAIPETYSEWRHRQ
jgi:Ca2+-binding RTX toxin-like protein